MGFLPATDERMRSTIEAIASDLTEDGLVLRYRNQEGLIADGLMGEEGTFVICSFWLVSALAKAGPLSSHATGLRPGRHEPRRANRRHEREARGGEGRATHVAAAIRATRLAELTATSGDCARSARTR
jgi:hypothetical protein